MHNTGKQVVNPIQAATDLLSIIARSPKVSVPLVQGILGVERESWPHEFGISAERVNQVVQGVLEGGSDTNTAQRTIFTLFQKQLATGKDYFSELNRNPERVRDIASETRIPLPDLQKAVELAQSRSLEASVFASAEGSTNRPGAGNFRS